MKKLLIMGFHFLACIVILNGQNFDSEKEESHHHLKDLLVTENWQAVYDYLESEVLADSIICNTNPVDRLVFGNACLSLKNWNQAMYCFYCSNDSLNSESLKQYLNFIKTCYDQIENSTTCYLLGDAYARLGKYDIARIYYDKSLALNNKNILALNARATSGWIQSVADSLPACLDCTNDWNKVVSIDPYFTDALVSIGVSRVLAGKYLGRAEGKLLQAISIDSNYILANNGLKVIYHKTNPEKYYEFANKSNGCVFAKMDESFLLLDSLLNDPNSEVEIRKVIDSLNQNKSRGVAQTAAATSIALGGPTNPAGLTAAGIAAGFYGISTVLQTVDNLSQQPSAGNYSKLARGGVYSYQIEGQNKSTQIVGVPSVTGTWFLLNYPSKVLFIN